MPPFSLPQSFDGKFEPAVTKLLLNSKSGAVGNITF